MSLQSSLQSSKKHSPKIQSIPIIENAQDLNVPTYVEWKVHGNLQSPDETQLYRINQSMIANTPFARDSYHEGTRVPKDDHLS